MIDSIEAAGLKFVGKDETGQRCEIFELEGHPYFVGVQYHPEFKSRPGRPSPPFLGFVTGSNRATVITILQLESNAVRKPCGIFMNRFTWNT